VHSPIQENPVSDSIIENANPNYTSSIYGVMNIMNNIASTLKKTLSNGKIVLIVSSIKSYVNSNKFFIYFKESYHAACREYLKQHPNL